MEQTLRALNISALAINKDTLRAAGQQNQNLWNTAASPTVSRLLLSPEQLASKNFSTFITNKIVFSRIVALIVDEIHLILSWGGPRFRVAFRDIGTVLHRLPRHTTGLTATPAAGEEVPKLMRILGLKPGSFVFHRRFNRRPELQFISNLALCVPPTLQPSARITIYLSDIEAWAAGWVFDWVLDGKQKTIIYCPSISLVFRIFVYLWRKSIPSDSLTHPKCFRLHRSLYSDCYNKTRAIFSFKTVLFCDVYRCSQNWK
ncbi:hypothetical protein K435DRAFT_760310 [Dendrothele bispora CBS 962.96]|uniref:Helicase ATP-binding domain-containing protein n=1 Tax=Dendrothele bispora (strain CBS 962.96) TaxID=1314807 RepID=A0A4S8LMX8_DENBC|nr:hypothetical protein K435DRAFT_760310 [Dendrothele bispora CBS 962.96]